ncbi:hypothetical protein [uncultured Dokdonia sp.]|nr:hypothetical protein [uncultured Dokdonia sp.]
MGKRIPIEVVDYLIIIEEGYTPFGDEGVMNQLKTSGRCEIVDPKKKAL